ncbi:MAG: tyrosine--tRNA ligase [Deltaproteobacteria bacterium]|nr:tyrosine--tRNA ligase [Deltaproteobacteria bacterium]
MGFIETLRERGLVAQITHEDELREHLQEAPRTAYIGFDPTAASLHVGSLLQIMTLRRWQQAGGRVVVVVGGGTVMVGDPTGKSELRQMLTAETITNNMVGIKKQLAHFIDFSSPARAVMVNNYDWLGPLNYLDFLREIGPHFSVNRMLTAECFKQRLEKGLSFLEFNYMLLQSYDFLHLYRQERCTLQMGGDDQWSNILAGMELVRRLAGGKAFCLTTPLLTTSDGRKMGKTEKGAVWLDGTLTSPYDYFQYWRNVEDSVVGNCLAYFTELPMAEVSRLAALPGAGINEAKKVLAFEATRLLHGKEAAEQAALAAEKLFAGGVAAGGNEPEVLLAASDLGEGLGVLDLLVKTKVVPSKAEARRLVEQGGLAINGEKVDDIHVKIGKSAFKGDAGCLVKKGKKHYFRLRLSD